tara:strand:- start:2311 stop:3144 length:834 start_codon:yes stop_codon:yes gene_type:complete
MIRRASVPGRINIIGEHTDYAGGCSLAFASPHRLVLEAEFVSSGFHGDETVVALWKEAGGPTARINVTSAIPIGKGMSSSAALCLAIVLCIHGPDLDKQDACVEAQRLEHVVLGTPCGLLDQMAMMYSEKNYCTLINFSSFETENIPYPSEWRFKLIDSGIHRTLNSKDYRQTASEETKQLHVASENKRVKQSLSVPTVEFGKLLNETHASLSRIGVSTPEIDAQVEIVQATEGVLGARMMGGGFGGMILVLVEDENIFPDLELIQPSRPAFVEELL